MSILQDQQGELTHMQKQRFNLLSLKLKIKSSQML